MHSKPAILRYKAAKTRVPLTFGAFQTSSNSHKGLVIIKETFNRDKHWLPVKMPLGKPVHLRVPGIPPCRSQEAGGTRWVLSPTRHTQVEFLAPAQPWLLQTFGV